MPDHRWWVYWRLSGTPTLVHAPDVKVSLPQLVVHSWDPDFPQNDGAIAHGSAAHLNEVLLDREVCELRITESSCSGPHPWLVLVPMMTRVNNFVLDPV